MCCHIGSGCIGRLYRSGEPVIQKLYGTPYCNYYNKQKNCKSYCTVEIYLVTLLFGRFRGGAIFFAWRTYDSLLISVSRAWIYGAYIFVFRRIVIFIRLFRVFLRLIFDGSIVNFFLFLLVCWSFVFVPLICCVGLFVERSAAVITTIKVIIVFGSAPWANNNIYLFLRNDIVLYKTIISNYTKKSKSFLNITYQSGIFHVIIAYFNCLLIK